DTDGGSKFTSDRFRHGSVTRVERGRLGYDVGVCILSMWTYTPMLLTSRICASARAKDQPCKLFDSQGLYLLTQPNGRKYWRLKYRFGGKEKLLALGVFPVVTLDAAREGAGQARELLARGIDPSIARKAAKRSAAAPARELTSATRGIKVVHNSSVRDPKSWKAAPLAEMPRLDGHLCFALYAASNHMNRLFVPFLKA